MSELDEADVRPRQYDLGELIARLQREEDPDRRVRYGFAHPHSYRGDYRELAFEARESVTVGEMLSDARSALGTTYEGWKGGDYTMSKDAYVWVVQEEGTSVGETLGALMLELMLAP